MSSRVTGAGLALIAVALLAISVATPVVLPAQLSLFAGHPTVAGHTRETQDVYVGFYAAELCNSGGDGTCKSGDAEKWFRVSGHVELGLTGILMAISVTLALLTLRKSERRKPTAIAAWLVGALALAGAAALIVQGPFQSASAPLGIGMALHGGGIVAAMLAGVLARLRPPPIRLRVAERAPSSAALPTAQAFDRRLRGDEPRRPGELGPDARFGLEARGRPAVPASDEELSDPFGSSVSGDRPVGLPQQLRPLYDAAPMQGGTGGLLPIERPVVPARPPTPMSRAEISAATGRPMLPVDAPPPVARPLPEDARPALPFAGESRPALPFAGEPRSALPFSGEPRPALPFSGEPRPALPFPGPEPRPMMSIAPEPRPMMSIAPEPRPMMSIAPEPRPMMPPAAHEPRPMMPPAAHEPRPMISIAGPEPRPMISIAGPEPRPVRPSAPDEPTTMAPPPADEPVSMAVPFAVEELSPLSPLAPGDPLRPPGTLPPSEALWPPAPMSPGEPLRPPPPPAPALRAKPPSVPPPVPVPGLPPIQTGYKPRTQVSLVPPMPDNDLPIAPPTAQVVTSTGPERAGAEPTQFPRAETPLAPPPLPVAPPLPVDPALPSASPLRTKRESQLPPPLRGAPTRPPPVRAAVPMPARPAPPSPSPTRPPPGAPGAPRPTIATSVPPIPAIPAIPPIPAPKRAETDVTDPEGSADASADADAATVSRIPIEVGDYASQTNVSVEMPVPDDLEGDEPANTSAPAIDRPAGHPRHPSPREVPRDTAPSGEPHAMPPGEPVAAAAAIAARPTIQVPEQRPTLAMPSAVVPPLARTITPQRAAPKLPISTAPDSLPPPKDHKQVLGPSPACPQCESPMAWVEEHLRFYCKSCRMYF